MVVFDLPRNKKKESGFCVSTNQRCCKGMFIGQSVQVTETNCHIETDKDLDVETVEAFISVKKGHTA